MPKVLKNRDNKENLRPKVKLQVIRKKVLERLEKLIIILKEDSSPKEVEGKFDFIMQDLTSDDDFYRRTYLKRFQL